MKIRIPQKHTQHTFVYPALVKIGPGFSRAIFAVAPSLEAVPNWIERMFNPNNKSGKPVIN
jgi:hypothetical protein